MLNIFLSLVVLFLCSCGADAGQGGFPAAISVTPHGHSNTNDGGILRTAGTSLYMNSMIQLDSAGTATVVTWTNELYDTISSHASGTSRVYVPTSYNYFRATCNCRIGGQVGDLGVFRFIRNGTTDELGQFTFNLPGSTNIEIGFTTLLNPVTAGDYIELQLNGSAYFTFNMQRASQSKHGCSFEFYR